MSIQRGKGRGYASWKALGRRGGREPINQNEEESVGISTKILCFGKPDENLQGFTVTKISMVKILFL